MLNGSRADAGIGYFKEIGGNFKFETYFGGGMGYLKNSVSSDMDTYQTTYNNIFGQFAFCYFQRRFNFTMGMRVSAIKFSSIHFDDSNYYIYLKDPVYNINHHLFSYYTPFMQLQAGRRAVKLNIQMGLELGYNDPYGEVIYNTSPIYLSVGAAIHIPRHGQQNWK